MIGTARGRRKVAPEEQGLPKQGPKTVDCLPTGLRAVWAADDNGSKEVCE